MKIVISDLALDNLKTSLTDFYPHLTSQSMEDMWEMIINRCEGLVENPEIGMKEPFLESLKQGHRRIIEGHFKIIYRQIGSTIFITDIFDSRQDPYKMHR